MTREEFSAKLKELRLTEHYTQDQVAEKSQVFPQAISRVELAKRKYGLEIAYKYLNELGYNLIINVDGKRLLATSVAAFNMTINQLLNEHHISKSYLACRLLMTPANMRKLMREFSSTKIDTALAMINFFGGTIEFKRNYLYQQKQL